MIGDAAQIISDIEALKKEIKMLRRIVHPNIVRYICTDVDRKRHIINILQEYVPGGSVRNLLDRFGPLDEKIVKVYTKQILDGLKYLHSQGIVHRNLKCSNILVDNEATVKLSDFGASRRISFSESHKKSQGESTKESITRTEFSDSLRASPYWMAPEVVTNTGVHKAADVWSVGCVMLEMRTGRPPWSELGTDVVKVLNAIATSTEGPAIPEGVFSDRALNCLKRCFAREPERRPTVEALLQDSFIVHQDGDSDSHAWHTVKQMSQCLQQENATATKKIEGAKAEDEISVSSSVIMEESLENGKTQEQIIQSKLAEELKLKEQAQQADMKRLKEEQRKKWEEELRKELERQKVKK